MYFIRSVYLVLKNTIKLRVVRFAENNITIKKYLMKGSDCMSLSALLKSKKPGGEEVTESNSIKNY